MITRVHNATVQGDIVGGFLPGKARSPRNPQDGQYMAFCAVVLEFGARSQRWYQALQQRRHPANC